MNRALMYGLLVAMLLGAGVASVYAGQPMLFLVVAAFVVFMLVRTMRVRVQRVEKPVAPVAIPPEEVELEEGPVQACMRCGSIRVRPANLSEGGIPGGGDGLTVICPRCRHRGPALVFDDATAYRQFVRALNEEGR